MEKSCTFCSYDSKPRPTICIRSPGNMCAIIIFLILTSNLNSEIIDAHHGVALLMLHL